MKKLVIVISQEKMAGGGTSTTREVIGDKSLEKEELAHWLTYLSTHFKFFSIKP